MTRWLFHANGIVLLLSLPLLGNAQVNSTWNAHVTVASDYLKHGLSQLDSGVSVQAGFDYQHHSGFFAGSTLRNVGYERERFRARMRDRQLAIYAGHTWDKDAWMVNLAVRHYYYPDISVNYDYTELGFNVVFKQRFFAGISTTNSLLARGNSAIDFETGLAWPLPWNSEFTTTIGRFRVNDSANTAYTHWNVGVSKIHQRFGFDLRFYDTSYSRVSGLGNPYPRRWVVAVSFAWAKR